MTPQEKLKALRKERNLTTYQLAELCELPQSTISKLENGRRRIDTEVLSKITKVLNVTIGEIFEEEHIEGQKDVQAPKEEEKFQQIQDIHKDEAIPPGDITKDFNNIMSKFYSNEGGPLFFNGVELEGENMELFEEALKLAIKTVKMKKR